MYKRQEGAAPQAARDVNRVNANKIGRNRRIEKDILSEIFALYNAVYQFIRRKKTQKGDKLLFSAVLQESFHCLG